MKFLGRWRLSNLEEESNYFSFSFFLLSRSYGKQHQNMDGLSREPSNDGSGDRLQEMMDQVIGCTMYSACS